MKVQLEDVVVLKIGVSTLGRFKTIKSESVERFVGEDQVSATAEGGGAEQEEAAKPQGEKKTNRKAVRVEKEYIPASFFKEITALDSRFESRFKRITQPGFFGTGDRLAHVAKVAQIHALVQKYTSDRGALVETFLGKLGSGEVAKVAAPLLGPLHDPEDYPSVGEARNKFGVSFLAIELGVHSKLPPEMKQQMEQGFTQKWKEAFAAGQKSLRADFLKAVQTLLGELQPGEGKKGKIYDSVVEMVKGFKEEFELRDMVGDDKLKELVAKVDAAMADVEGADVLRNYKGTANGVAAALKEVLPQAEELARVFD